MPAHLLKCQRALLGAAQQGQSTIECVNIMLVPESMLQVQDSSGANLKYCLTSAMPATEFCDRTCRCSNASLRPYCNWGSYKCQVWGVGGPGISACIC